MRDYDSRRTGNGLLDTGSTPVWSTGKVLKMPDTGVLRIFLCEKHNGPCMCIYGRRWDSFTIHWTSFPFGGKMKSNTVYANEGKRGV